MGWRVVDHGGDDGSSMARSTGMVTACCVEEWLDDPEMLPPGVHAPEALAPEVVARIIETMSSERVSIDGPGISIGLLREVFPVLPDEVPHAHRNGNQHPQRDYWEGPAHLNLCRPLNQPREDYGRFLEVRGPVKQVGCVVADHGDCVMQTVERGLRRRQYGTGIIIEFYRHAVSGLDGE